MKIAVLGDIHGNIEALKATYSAAISAKVDKIYHLGDLGGYAPFVNEVVDFVIEHGIDGVQGNYDFNVAHDSKHCGCKYEDPVQAELADKSFEWTKRHSSQKTKDFLGNLPASISFTSHGKQIMIFHAAPHKNNLYWHEDRPERFFLEMAEKTKADVMIYGHTHKPYRKDIRGKVFINAGSVGKPKDGDSRACVTLIEILGQEVTHEFLRVPYAIETVISAILASDLPPALADKLREAR
jgi:putative phosphoesterase